MFRPTTRPSRKPTVALRLAATLTVLAVAGAHAAIPPAERGALTALYDATGGDAWTNRSGWRSADGAAFGEVGSECAWFGVTCDPDGAHVVGVALAGNGLSGVLPDLSALAALEVIDLSRNQLTPGPIPAWLGSLPQLRTLDLEGTRRRGAIPDLSALGSLTVLRLGNNRGLAPGPVPDWISGLADLAELSLWRTNRTGAVPAWLASKARLEKLDLYDNDLAGELPAWLGDLTALSYLNLSSNRFSGAIPPELGSLSNLTRLDLDGNQLGGAIP